MLIPACPKDAATATDGTMPIALVRSLRFQGFVRHCEALVSCVNSMLKRLKGAHLYEAFTDDLTRQCDCD